MITLTHSLHHTRRPSTGHTEGHTAVLHIRTRDIQFDGGNLLQRVDTGSTLGIVLRRRPAHVDDHVRVDILDLGVDLLTEIVHTLVLQTHAVQHSTGRLRHPGVVITLAGLQRRTLHDNAANTVQRHQVGKLQTVAEGARGRHHGILQRQILDLYI